MIWYRKKSGVSELESRGNRIAYVNQVAGLWFGWLDEGVSMAASGPLETEQQARLWCRIASRKFRKSKTRAHYEAQHAEAQG